MRHWTILALGLLLSGCAAQTAPPRGEEPDTAWTRLDEKVRRIEALDKDIRRRLAELDEAERRRLAAEVRKEREEVLALKRANRDPSKGNVFRTAIATTDALISCLSGQSRSCTEENMAGNTVGEDAWNFLWMVVGLVAIFGPMA